MIDAPRLTSLAHGGGCGCKLAPSVLRSLLAATRDIQDLIQKGMLTKDEAGGRSTSYSLCDQIDL